MGGMALTARSAGNPNDPSVLVLENPVLPAGFWNDLVAMLVKAGRQVISLPLSPQGQVSHSVNLEALKLDSLRAVLGQLPMRPLVLAAGQDAPIAAGALAVDIAALASGLILLDPVTGPQYQPADPVPQNLPVLVVSGLHSSSQNVLDYVACSAPGAEVIELLDGAQHYAGETPEALNAVLIDFLERRLPRANPEYRLGSDARTLRDALGCFATGVTILTAKDEAGAPIGLTANSFTSVSLDPPLLLACIATTATSADVFRIADHFAVNVLHIGQQPASIRFSRRGEDRFGATPWESGLNGTPVLTGSLATFECTRHAVHDGGDHIILIGQVERARFEPQRDPLLYFRGKYRRLHFS